MIALYNPHVSATTETTKLFLRDGYHKYDVEVRTEMEEYTKLDPLSV